MDPSAPVYKGKERLVTPEADQENLQGRYLSEVFIDLKLSPTKNFVQIDTVFNIPYYNIYNATGDFVLVFHGVIICAHITYSQK